MIEVQVSIIMLYISQSVDRGDTPSTVSPMDYMALSVILIFQPCDTKHCASVGIVNDKVPELEENFTYTVGRTYGMDPRIIIDHSVGEVVIVDKYIIL